MNQIIQPIVIEVSNHSAFSGRGSIIVLELADEAAAKKLAQKIARERRGVRSPSEERILP